MQQPSHCALWDAVCSRMQALPLRLQHVKCGTIDQIVYLIMMALLAGERAKLQQHFLRLDWQSDAAQRCRL